MDYFLKCEYHAVSVCQQVRSKLGCSIHKWIIVAVFQNAVEPMQVDAPPEENENVEEEHFIVENTSLVSLVTNLSIGPYFIVYLTK